MTRSVLSRSTVTSASPGRLARSWED
jgi:hypothetical protein